MNEITMNDLDCHDSETVAKSGPLAGIRVLEMSAIGPVPFAGMILADMGATVVRVDRPEPANTSPTGDRGVDVFGRGKRSIVVDLKNREASAFILQIVQSFDVLLEGLRPGVMERLGVGPDACLAANNRLVYGRMTGYGQQGPLAQEAGHDLNYISIAGALSRIGRVGQAPVPPLNLVGDYGGGAMFLVAGVLGALVERATSGLGQVVDAAMIDGAALLTAGSFDGLPAAPRGSNLLDSGAPFYEVYETADNGYMSAGPIEPKFWAALLSGLGLDPALVSQDKTSWTQSKKAIAAAFKKRTRNEWTKAFLGTDACVTPVLEHNELFDHPHHVARSSFVQVDGVLQPAPAPRLSRSVPTTPTGAPAMGENTDEILREAGIAEARIASLHSAGVVSGGRE